MSRIGKKPILIPQGVEAKIDGQKIVIKGPKGELSREIPPEIGIETKEGKISLQRRADNKKSNSLWGLTRALVANMIKGVSEGYEKKLEMEGLGYRVQLSGENLVLDVGLSHTVEIKAIPGIKFSVEKNVIRVSGADKELVGQTAANIRKVRPPEPYKGTGIRYEGERIRKKVGKKAVAAGAGAGGK
jgi:large subunit ribosomal protein L6